MKEKKQDATIISTDGKILFYCLEHFLHDIRDGDCCFICGAQKNSKDFNDEHVIPDWILKKFNLHSKQITLTNGTRIRYNQYKIPCCVDCNSALGKFYEEPISEVLSGSYTEAIQKIKEKKGFLQLLFKWLCLLFFKTHLKDTTLLADRDVRKDSGKLSAPHFWEDFHHIHCIARSHYTEAIIDSDVYGTMLILPALEIEGFDPFDYVDSPYGKAVMVTIGEICIISVLDDARACISIYHDDIKKIAGALTKFQLRELTGLFNFFNMSLVEKPVFHSQITTDFEYKITARVPKMWRLLDEKDLFVTPGQFLKYYVKDLIGNFKDKDQILTEIEEGKRTYLFDEKGVFIDHS